jgi:rubrerythrin
MESKNRLTELIKKQIEIEKEHVERINDLYKKVDTSAARLLLLEMRLDSQKHANILSAILQVLKGIPSSKTLWEHRVDSYVDKIVVKRELEKHVEMETEVLNHVEDEIAQTQDEGLKLLLQHIADDEKKHHKILKTIVRYAYKINP